MPSSLMLTRHTAPCHALPPCRCPSGRAPFRPYQRALRPAPCLNRAAGAATTAAVQGAETGSSARTVAGLSELVAQGRYKALLLDQFGVLHDGRRPYPGAVEAVTAAASAGLALLVISNSSRRSGGTLDKLAGMGFPREAFVGAVTSGELTHKYLSDRADTAAGFGAANELPPLGRRCLHINWSKRGPVDLSEYGLELVVDPRDADFIIAHGTEAVSLPGGGVRNTPLSQLKELLLEAAAEAAEAAADGRTGAEPPVLVVANPDVVTVDGGELVDMPGALAAAYSAAGGPVVLMGKPAPLIYGAAGLLLGVAHSGLLAVGDSLEHDIAGAVGAGIDTFFIGGGIHARELLPAGAADAEVDREALQRLCGQHLKDGEAPTYVAPRFVW